MSSAAQAPAFIGELDDGREVAIEIVGAQRADELAEVIRSAFAARPPVDPPPPALSETPASVVALLEHGLGVLASVAGVPAGVILIELEAGSARLARVSVRPQFQRHGLATIMIGAVLELLAERGVAEVDLLARREFPQVGAWWRRHGFVVVGQAPPCEVLARRVPALSLVPTADDMRELGRRLAGILRPGDVIIASGELGAGKTTLAQGLGEGLDVAGPVISPTFVLSRVHPARGVGPALVHVDAYRLGDSAELEDLDLEFSLAEAITLIEWGTGVAEGLSDDRLEVDIRRGDDPADETRVVLLTGVGGRWAGVDLPTTNGASK